MPAWRSSVLPGAATFVSRDPDTITEEAARRASRKLDVYVHIHMHNLPIGHGPQRGNRDTVRAAAGLFSDIDARGPGRKKPAQTLCPNVASSIAVAEEFNSVYAPLQISLVIGSGFGCYPAILLKEPLVIESSADSALLESLGRRFHGGLDRIACEHGWTGAVDYCDPAKVLRLPGCVNFKDPSNPRPVSIVYESDARFTLFDLEEALPPLATRLLIPGASLPAAEVKQSDLALTDDVDVAGLVDALRQVHPFSMRRGLAGGMTSGINRARHTIWRSAISASHAA